MLTDKILTFKVIYQAHPSTS